MHIGTYNTDDRVFIIAEIGNNHEGDFGRATEMIHVAAETGVDAIKFQTIVPERLVSPTHKERIATLNRFRFSYDQFAQLATTCRNAEVLFLSTPFDLESVSFLNQHVPAFKIASSDNTFFPLLAAIADTQKPVLLSAGLCTAKEIMASIDFLKNAWGISEVFHRLAVLHCVTSYPTPVEQANLAAIAAIAEIGVTPGYSDHTLGIEAAVLSVACGARIIEKHFTLDKNLSDFRDHRLSADPQDLLELVRRTREAEAMLGDATIQCAACEAKNKASVRRSIVAKTSLTAGARLTLGDLDWLRPGMGLAPGREAMVLGRRLKQAKNPGEMILNTDLE